MAVSSYAKEGNKTLAESWNGREWSIQSSPNPAGQALPRLRAVSCSAATACTAVGYAKGSWLEEKP